jgi:signal transduction histidine kinase
LNAILGFSEGLRDGHFGTLTDAQRSYVQDIHTAGKHLLDLISSILDISKIEMNRAALDESVLDLGAVVADALKMMHDRWSRDGLSFHAEIERALPPVRADAMRLKQVLLNLLSNAAKFTPSGGDVALHARRTQNGRLRITISDTGVGMSATDIPKALTPFGQVQNALSRKHDGVGLGLPLSKAFVDLHQGLLHIQSQPGAGTTVTVELPAERLLAAAPTIGT